MTVVKRNSFAELPNVLIFHLQRIQFDYDTFQNQKINSRLEFPKQLNVKPYCTKIESSEKPEGNAEGAENAQEDEIQYRVYDRDDDYYIYELVGVVVHLGTADAGHYYSYINVKRNGSEDPNKMDFDPNNEIDVKKWLTFNDSSVTSYILKNLEEDCFGGESAANAAAAAEDITNIWKNTNKVTDFENNKNAYMLVYERVKKNPLLMTVQNEADLETLLKDREVIKYTEKDKYKVMKQFDLFNNHKNVALDCEDTAISRCDIFSKVFYDEDRKEYTYYRPFYSVNKSIPQHYLQQVTMDNITFLNDQKIYSKSFSEFLEKLLASVNEQIKQNLLDPELIKVIYENCASFIIQVISKSDFKEVFFHLKIEYQKHNRQS